MSNNAKNVLIAYLPNRKDFRIAYDKHWYRIPVSKKIVPNNVKNNSIELMAFYQPKSFKEDAFAVRFYAKVKDIKIVKRKYLLKDEPINQKSEDEYYKIRIEKLMRLPRAILSLRHRRIIFITTTLERFQKAEEINDLFYESPLEEKFWKSFKKEKIFAERQYYEKIGKDRFILDFAIFCKNTKLDVECDSDTYHMKKKIVQKDKRRDNILQSHGWNILRYTSEDIDNNFNNSVMQVRDAINRYGGECDFVDEK